MNYKTFLKKNNSKLCTVFGIVSFAATISFTIKATVKATRQIDEIKRKDPGAVTKKQLYKIIAKNYIPMGVTFISTVGFIIGAKQLDFKKQSALIGSYKALENKYKVYTDKVKEAFGEDKEKELTDSIHKEEYVKAAPIDDYGDIYYFGYDVRNKKGGEYFRVTQDKLEHAETALNKRLRIDGFASVADFFDDLGIEPSELSVAYGWGPRELCALDNGWITLETDQIQSDNGEIINVVEFSMLPSDNYENKYMWDGDYPVWVEDYELEDRKAKAYKPYCNVMADKCDEAAQKTQPV